MRLGLLNIFLFVVACRTDAPPQEPLHLRPGPFALDVMADPLPIEAVAEIKGFDADGEVTCLPLVEPSAAATHCIPRKDPLEEPCAAARGELLTCQDCSRLCTVPTP